MARSLPLFVLRRAGAVVVVSVAGVGLAEAKAAVEQLAGPGSLS